MKKLLVIFAFLVTSLSYALVTLDEVKPDTGVSFQSQKMLNDPFGNTFVFWVETETVPFQGELYSLKWAYKPVSGSFTDKQTLVQDQFEFFDSFIYDAAIDNQGNVCVLWKLEGDGVQSAYRPAGDSSSFTVTEAFDGDILENGLQLKAAPNGTFLAVFLALTSSSSSSSIDYFWSERKAGASKSFSTPKFLSGRTDIVGLSYDDFDFDFDDQSNTLFMGFYGSGFATVFSDVFVSFKPVNSNFLPTKSIQRISDKYFVDHANVVFNQNSNGERTWSVFWEEATTDNVSGGTFFLRGQYLNNNATNTNIEFSSSAKTLYVVKNRITDQFTVNKIQNNQVLAMWGEDSNSILYSLYDLNGLLSGKTFEVQSIGQAGINPVNMNAVIQNGFSFIAWNTGGQQGGDVRWGYIPSQASNFTYEGSLQSYIPGMTPFALAPKIGLTVNTPIFSWLGSSALQFANYVVQAARSSNNTERLFEANNFTPLHFQKGALLKQSAF